MEGVIQQNDKGFAEEEPETSFITLVDNNGVFSCVLEFLMLRTDVFGLVLVNKALRRSVEAWCRCAALPRAVAAQEQQLACFPSDVSFAAFRGFLAALHAPLGTFALARTPDEPSASSPQSAQPPPPLLLDSCWRYRVVLASNPRPKREGALGTFHSAAADPVRNLTSSRFDFGRPDGFYCDAFGSGNGRADYVRQVRTEHGEYRWAVAAAGSDGPSTHTYLTDADVVHIKRRERVSYGAKAFVCTVYDTAYDVIFREWMHCIHRHHNMRATTDAETCTASRPAPILSEVGFGGKESTNNDVAANQSSTFQNMASS